MKKIVLFVCCLAFWLSSANMAGAGGVDIMKNADGTYKFKFLVNIDSLPKKNATVFFLDNLENADKSANNNAVMLFTYDEKIIEKIKKLSPGTKNIKILCVVEGTQGTTFIILNEKCQ